MRAIDLCAGAGGLSLGLRAAGFVFDGGIGAAARQIGNAVPPPLGAAMGGSVRVALRGVP